MYKPKVHSAWFLFLRFKTSKVESSQTFLYINKKEAMVGRKRLLIKDGAFDVSMPIKMCRDY